MALWIHNVTKGEVSDSNPHDYELKINRKVLCTFQHIREKGAVDCLRAAADALERYEAIVSSLYDSK